jgi:methionyl-tRNA formyltransferase
MSLKIIFMGTPNFSVPILKSINNSRHRILAVYTNPPKKKARGQKIVESPIHQAAKKLKIPVRCPNNFEIKEEYKFIKKINPDIAVVAAYGKILPSRILKLENTQFINIHASLLPKWRGAAPIQRAIMNLDKETGFSIMKIVEELDAGPTMKKVKINIEKDSTYESLSKKISLLSANTIIECLDIIEKNEQVFISQENNKATYAKKINKIEAKINWNDKAKNIIAKINALYPNPGSWFYIDQFRVKIIKAKEIAIKGKPGEVLDNKLTIACDESAIQITELQKEGKKAMSADNFLLGNKIIVGTNLNES